MTLDPRLHHQSVLRWGVDPSGGYAFGGRLSDAITDVVARSRLDFDGLELGPAVQRALFIDLVNRPALYDAFVGGGAPVPVANELEGDVVTALLPEARIEWARRGRWMQGLADMRRRARRRGLEVSGAKGVTFVALTDKFRRFIEPITPAGSTVVEAASGHVPRRVPQPLRSYPGVIAFADALGELARTRRPSVLVAVEGNAPTDAAVAAVARRAGIPSVVLQQGWSPQVHAGFRGLPFDEMLVWGDGFADELRRFNPHVNFRIVGNHAIEPRREPPAPDDPVGVFLQSTSHLISPSHVDQLVTVVERLARSVPRVLVREHPGAPLDDTVRARLRGVELANAPIPLAGVLGRCRAAVSIYSTTLYEAVSVGALPVSFNPTSLPSLAPSIAAHRVGFEVKTAEEVIAVTESGAVNAEDRNRFTASYFPYLGADAAARALRAIDELAEKAVSCRGR